MPYTKTNWLDRIVQFPRRYKDQNNNQITLTPDPGTVTQEGTPVNATRLNKMEQGIADAHTPSVILDYLKTVDGAGSGLDADLFDGVDSTGFMRSAQSAETDLNKYTISGVYRLASGHLNAPPGVDWGQLFVGRGGGDTVFQIVTGYTIGSGLWFRNGNPPEANGVGIWQSWQQMWDTSQLRKDANGNLEVLHGGVWRKVSTPTIVASTNVKESFPTERVGLPGNHMLVTKHIPQGVGEVLITADLDYMEGNSTQLVLVTPTVYTSGADATFEPRNNTQRFDWRTPLGTNIVFDFSYGYNLRQHSLLSRGSPGYVTLSTALTVKDKTPLYIFLTGSNGCKVKNITISYDVI